MSTAELVPTPKEIAKQLSDRLRKKLAESSDYKINEKEDVLEFANDILSECDEISSEVGLAMDYLQCQVDHKKAQDKALKVLDYGRKFNDGFGDLRYEIRRMIEPLMESLRYGKRSEEVDQVLIRLTSLTNLASQSPAIQPNVNFAGIEGALSTRCQTCEAPCRSAFRIVKVFVRKVINCVRETYEPEPKTENS